MDRSLVCLKLLIQKIDKKLINPPSVIEAIVKKLNHLYKVDYQMSKRFSPLFESTNKFGGLKIGVPAFSAQFLDSKYVLNVYFKPKRKDLDFGFITISTFACLFENHHDLYWNQKNL